jgi:hypothetical protein
VQDTVADYQVTIQPDDWQTVMFNGTGWDKAVIKKLSFFCCGRINLDPFNNFPVIFFLAFKVDSITFHGIQLQYQAV